MSPLIFSRFLSFTVEAPPRGCFVRDGFMRDGSMRDGMHARDGSLQPTPILCRTLDDLDDGDDEVEVVFPEERVYHRRFYLQV